IASLLDKISRILKSLPTEDGGAPFKKGRIKLRVMFAEEGFDTLGDRRMGRKEFIQKSCCAAGTERVGDKEMCCCMVRLSHWTRVLGNLLQRRGESFRIARQDSTRGIGEEFALARDGKLHERRDDGRE